MCNWINLKQPTLKLNAQKHLEVSVVFAVHISKFYTLNSFR